MGWNKVGMIDYVYRSTLVAGFLVLIKTGLDGFADFRKDGFLFLEMIVGIGLIFIPFLIKYLFNVDFPLMIKINYWIFLVLSVFLGTGLKMMVLFSHWDKMLHLYSGSVITMIGYSMFLLIFSENKEAKSHPIAMISFGFCFATTCGVLWEFYEFICDQFLQLNLQRYLSHGIPLVGRAALMDTMGDLWINMLGTIIITVISLIVSKKTTDYLSYYEVSRDPERC